MTPVATDATASSAASQSANTPDSVTEAPTTITLSSDKETFTAGSLVTLTATVDVELGPTSSTIAITDVTTNEAVKYCNTGTTCSVTYVPFYSGGPHVYAATVNALTSNQVTVAREAWTVSLVSDRSTFTAGESFTLTATTNQNLAGTSGTYFLRIYDSTTDEMVGYCNTGSTCSISTRFLAGAPHDYVATVASSAPTAYVSYSAQTDIQATSNTISLAREAWTVTLSADKTIFADGESVTLTATANQSTAGSSGAYAIYIYDRTTGETLGRCAYSATCGASVSFVEGGPHNYVAAVSAYTFGNLPLYEAQSDVQATSNTVVVARQAWSVALTINKTSFSAGEPVTLTATPNQVLASGYSGYGIRIYDKTAGTTLAFCYSGATCSAYPSFQAGAPHVYVADIASVNGSTYPSYGSQTDIQATSNEVSLARSPWAVALTIDKTHFEAGYPAVLTATANQNPALTSFNYAIRIYDVTDGTTLAFCYLAATCVASGSFLDGPPHTYVADVASTNGQYLTYGAQQDIQATSNTVSAARKPWTISLQGSASITSAPYGTVTLLATTNQSVLYTGGHFIIWIVDYTTGNFVAKCYEGTTCTATPSFDAREGRHQYFAMIASPLRTNVQATSNGYSADTGTGTGAILAGESRGGGNPAEPQCQCSHVDPVNSATGEFYLPATDIALPGAGPALSIDRTYSTSSATADGPFGFGWSAGFGAKLAVTIPGDTDDPRPRQVEVVQENGSTVAFTEAPDGTYSAASRVRATLVLNPVSHHWIYTRQATEVLEFDAAGLLLSTADVHGNTVTVGRDSSGRLATLTASGGRSLTLTWAGSHVSKVTDSAGREVDYSYDGSGNLSSVTAVDDKVSTYAYNSTHLMTSLTTPGGGVTSNTFDSSKRVLTQTDPLNRVTTFVYSGSTTTVTAPDGSVTTEVYTLGRLTSRTVAAGTADAATSTLIYDAGSNVTSVTDPLGNITNSTYDAEGNRLTSTDPLGRVSSWTYNEWRKPLTSTDPLGNVTTMTYDSAGNLLTATSPSGRVQSFTYNANGTVATSTDAGGKVTSFTYDTAGRLATTTNPDGLVTSLTYNAAGQGTSVTSPDGATASTVSDAVGRMLTVTDPLGRVTSFGYDAAGRRTSTTDALGNVTYAVFDAAGQQASTTDAAGNITQYTYTPAGQLATVCDAQNHVTTLAYNARGELLSTTDAAGRVSSQTYDLAGRVTSSTRPSGAVSTVAYDAAGQVTSSTDPGAFATTFTYNAAGKPLTITDALGRVTTTAYGLDGEVASVTLPDSSTQSYGYDAAGRATSFTNADGKITTYAYGNSGQLLGKVEPGGLTTTFAYDDGRLQSSTLPDATTTTFTYDVAGNALTADRSSTPFVDAAYVYDALNRATSVTDPTGTSAFTYDSRGNLLTEVDGGGESLGYAYDSIGQLETITYPGSKEVDYGYDAVGQLTSLTDWLDNESTFTWTVDGQLDTQTSGNGVVQSRDYDSRGQLTDTEVTGLTASLASFAYGFDAVGQLTSTETTLDGQDVDRAFEYDPLSQLAKVATTVGTTTTSEDYAATSAGLLTEIVGGRELTYNAAQQLVSADAIIGPDITFAYDTAGRRTSSAPVAGTATAYGYDAAGYLATVATPTATVGFTTDARGLRQTRTAGTTTDDFLWSTVGGLPLLLDDGDHAYIYGPSSTPIAQIADDGTVEYLHTDLLGSVRLITDEDGDAVATATFDEFGTRVNHTGTADSAFGFTGAWTDPDTGLVHLRARDYDPATGQFLTVDPAVDQTRQPYAYTGNNPLTRTDPTGLDSITLGPEFYGRAAMGIILGPGSLRVMDELNAGTDLWSAINMGYNPVYMAIERYDSFRAAGNDWWAAGVMAFNPVYDVIAGLDKAFKATEQGCTTEAVEGYMQAASGVVGTGLLAAGGIGGLRGLTGSSSAATSMSASSASRAPTASSGSASASPQLAPVPFGPAPANAWSTLERVDSKGSPLSGYKGGSIFKNVDTPLPSGVNYREWDVNPNIPGVDRGPERIITGDDGSAYYTNNHYDSFTLFRGPKE